MPGFAGAGPRFAFGFAEGPLCGPEPFGIFALLNPLGLVACWGGEQRNCCIGVPAFAGMTGLACWGEGVCFIGRFFLWGVLRVVVVKVVLVSLFFV